MEECAVNGLTMQQLLYTCMTQKLRDFSVVGEGLQSVSSNAGTGVSLTSAQTFTNRG